MPMNGAPLKVLIADDHPLILAGLRRALERSDGVEVVGEAHTFSEVMPLIERRLPDIVLLDLRMPDVTGTEHIQQVLSSWPDLKVVVISGNEDQPSIDASLRAGARAFVVKSISPSDVAAILRQVAGGAVFHPVTQTGSGDTESAGRQLPGLTGQERKILGAAARGMTTAEISKELWVSEHTVKFHLTNIYRKLGVGNRAAAVRFAIENGLADS